MLTSYCTYMLLWCWKTTGSKFTWKYFCNHIGPPQWRKYDKLLTEYSFARKNGNTIYACSATSMKLWYTVYLQPTSKSSANKW